MSRVYVVVAVMAALCCVSGVSAVARSYAFTSPAAPDCFGWKIDGGACDAIRAAPLVWNVGDTITLNTNTRTDHPVCVTNSTTDPQFGYADAVVNNCPPSGNGAITFTVAREPTTFYLLCLVHGNSIKVTINVVGAATGGAATAAGTAVAGSTGGAAPGGTSTGTSGATAVAAASPIAVVFAAVAGAVALLL